MLRIDIDRGFGVALRALRLARHYSQGRLARIAALDRSYISLVERGKRSPTLKTIVILAHALDLEVLDLIGCAAAEASGLNRAAVFGSARRRIRAVSSKVA